MSEQEIIELMSSSKSEQEWNHNRDKVKSRHNGQYPDAWYRIVIKSGLHSNTSSKW